MSPKITTFVGLKMQHSVECGLTWHGFLTWGPWRPKGPWR